MLVFEGVWVICENPSLLYSLNMPIKMFANSVTALTPKTLDRPSSLLSNTVDGKLSSLVLGRKESRLLFRPLPKKTVWIPRLGSELMVSGIDHEFTFCSKLFVFLKYVHSSTRPPTTI